MRARQVQWGALAGESPSVEKAPDMAPPSEIVFLLLSSSKTANLFQYDPIQYKQKFTSPIIPLKLILLQARLRTDWRVCFCRLTLLTGPSIRAHRYR